MKPHEINNLDNFIMAWYPDDTSFCDDVLKYFNDPLVEKSPGYIADTITGKISQESYKRSTDAMFINQGQDCSYFKHLRNCLTEYANKYAPVREYEFTMIQPPNIQWYKPGEGYTGWHSERSNNRPPYVSRFLVFMTYLNTVTDEGETEFLYQKIKVKPVKGLTVLWPSDWPWTHRGVPSTTQDKYIITGWFNFSSPKPNSNYPK